MSPHLTASQTFADLTPLVAPRSIAIVGASEKGLGGNVTRNLVTHSQFDGPVHLVSRNPEVFGLPTVPSLDAVDGPVDVVLVVVGRERVPDVLRQAQARDAKFAVVMAAGFAEAGDETGLALDAEIRQILAAGTLRLVGPNCPGLGDLGRPLGLTLQPGFADETGAGSIGVVAQSGGLTRCILQAVHRGGAFSYFFSPGNQVDLDIADFTNFLVDDPATDVIALAVEHFPSGGRFAVAAERARAADKPIVLLKTGTSDAGRAAASSHTGAIVGSRDALEAVARKLGIVLVDDINHLVNAAAHLRRKAAAHGAALVFGMSGGAAVVVTDALAREGVGLAELSSGSVEALRTLLPDGFPVSNPLDLAAASFVAGAFKESLRIGVRDANVGVVVVMFNAWYAGLSRLFADACTEVAAETETSIVPVWMSACGGPELDDLEAAGLFPCRSAAEAAVVARAILSRSPGRAVADEPLQLAGAEVPVLAPGLLLEDEGKDLLRAVGVPVTRESVVDAEPAAAGAAAAIGYPVIAKVVSAGATHRAGTGLVSGAIRDQDELRAAWSQLRTAAARHLPDEAAPRVLIAEYIRDAELEAYVGLVRDPEWGPLLSFGMGGRWIEELRDAVLLPLPATRSDVAEALGRSKLAHAMARVGLPAAVREQFVDVVTWVGALASARPEIAELDVNPVLLTATRAVAVDALFRVD